MSYCNRRLSLIFVMFVIVILLTALPALAGSGDGSGGGQGVPLRLDSSSPYNGQTGVALPLVINMTFNKNVINMTVNDNNRNCFSLYTADGSKVPVEVIMADDQIEPEKKRDIALKPLQDLKPGAAYTVKVSSALQAKSGVSMENDLTITFITASGGAAPDATNSPTPQNAGSPLPASPAEPIAAQAGQGDNSTGATTGVAAGAATSATSDAPSAGGGLAAVSGDNATGARPNSSAVTSSEKGEAVNAGQSEEKGSSGAGVWLAIAAGLLLVATAGHVIYRRKK